MVKNLNIVLDTTVKHRKDFDQTVDNFEKLISGLNNHADSFAAGIANISNGAGTVADLLADNRTLLHKTLNYLEPIQQPIIDQQDLYDDQIHRTPIGMNIVGNARRQLRRLGQLLLVRPHPQDQRTAGRRPGPHGQDLVAADG